MSECAKIEDEWHYLRKKEAFYVAKSRLFAKKAPEIKALH
jgi:hypothetical protein